MRPRLGPAWGSVGGARRGRPYALTAPGVTLDTIVARDGDPDHLLTSPDCRIVKLQRKVMVGRVASRLGTLYVKRYNVFAWRVALGSLGRPSPALRAWRAAARLGALGLHTPQPVAAIEFRTAGVLRRSFFLTREVEGSLPADRRWEGVLAEPDALRRRAARRALARELGLLFRRLHAAGVYHNDLKDANILVTGPSEAPRFVLLDLERVRVGGRVPRRRRVKNLVQLARTLGRHASAADAMRFLDAYLGAGTPRGERRGWARAVLARARAKDRRRATPPAARPRVSCTVICQDEEREVERCLESVVWCDEVVVVDGGSQDGTLAVARRFTDRVLQNPWPGHRAQKQCALDAATGEWVLNVDADEQVTAELAAEVRRVLADVPANVNGFEVARLVCYLGRWWQRGALYPRPIVRLVRRSATTWGGRDPHEHPVVRGRIRRLRYPILHYTYDDIADHVRSVNSLTTAMSLHADGSPPGPARLVFEPIWRFIRSYLVWRGALDGVPGLFVAATSAFYVTLRGAKEWERWRSNGA